MIENIHYDDDIFYLSLMVKTIGDSFRLKVDPIWFSDRILEEILFVDTTIQKIYSLLRDNRNLIKRLDYLHSLLRLKRNFSLILNEFLKLDPEERPEAKSFAPQIQRSLDIHENDIMQIKTILRDNGEPGMQEDAISNDELHYLMAPVPSGDDEE
jgi:hypothetical protein